MTRKRFKELRESTPYSNETLGKAARIATSDRTDNVIKSYFNALINEKDET